MNELTVTGRTDITAAHALSADLFDRWLSFIGDAAPKTIETYTRNIRQFLRWLQENNITQPKRGDIIAYRDYLKDSGKAPSTRQGYLQTVKLFFKWTASENLYENIADEVKGVKLDSNKAFKKDYLTSKQVGRFLGEIDRDTLKGKRDYAILSLMVTTGLRTIEVARANLEDLRTVADFTALYIQGKGHEDREEFVKIAEPVEEALVDYLKARGKRKRGKNEKAEDSKTDPLFISISNRDSGGRMTTRSISRIAKDHLVEAGLDSDRLTAHSLRHTTATLNLLNGGTIEETQQLLRHANINTTLIYSHALERANSKSEARVANAIFG